MKNVTSPQCILFLESLSVPYPALLIDNHVLDSLHNEQCEKHHLKIKVAIDSKYKKKRDNESLLSFEFFEMNNRTNKDYLQFSTQPTRVIPKNFETYSIGNLSIPTNIPMFLKMWKRAVLLKCLNLPVQRNRTKINDSFELTITSKDSYPMNMDLFVMYEEINKDGSVMNWVGGASE
ncbi:unnamed protein product [Caenorhabditis nigoni]